MNYKQCEEFIELNRGNPDLPTRQFQDLRNKLLTSLRLEDGLCENQTILIFEEAGACEWAMLYMEKALKLAGTKAMCYSQRALGDYRERWKVGCKCISQKSLCEVIEALVQCLAQSDAPSLKQIEDLVAEVFFIQSGAKVLLCDKSFSALSQWERGCFEVKESEELVYKVTKKNLKKQVFDYKNWKAVQLSSLGKEAVSGACVAFECLPLLEQRGLEVKEQHLKTAFEETYAATAFSVFGTKPFIVLANVRDEQSARDLQQNIKDYLPEKLLVGILGARKDTDTQQMLSSLCQSLSYILTVAPPVPDRIPAYELAQEVLKLTPSVTAVDSVEEAFEIVKMILSKEGVVLAVGCPQLLSKVMEIVNK